MNSVTRFTPFPARGGELPPEFRLLGTFFLAFVLLGCGSWGYGPKRDYSSFHHARLFHDREKILFTAHLYVYRPARGLLAFPDGGTPRYLIDRNVLGVYDRTTDRLTPLIDESNEHWSHGQGQFSIVDLKEPTALILQSGQRRDNLMHDHLYRFVNVKTGEVRPLPLTEELRRRGRARGYIHVIRPDGTLLLITPGREEKEKHLHWNRKPSIVPELWIRHPDGRYEFVARTRHFQNVHNGNIVYWNPESRRYRGYDLDRQQTRVLADYRRPAPDEHAWSVDVEDTTLRLRRRDRSGRRKILDLPITLSRLRRELSSGLSWNRSRTRGAFVFFWR